MGLAIAKRLVELGAKVAIADINVQAAQEGVALMGDACIAVRVSLVEEKSIELAIAEVEKQYGRLDLVANCAGVQLTTGPLVALTTENIARTLDTNLKGLLFCLKYELNLIKKNGADGGTIVNIASAAASQPLAFNGPYSASKAGVVAITKSVASEESSNHIGINCISPGYIDTPMMREANITSDFAKKNTPIGRCGEPNDIADLAIFLLSEDSKQIQGIDVPIDGGMLLGNIVKPPGY